MQLIVFKFQTENPSSIDVPMDGDVDLLRQMIQAELGIPFHQQVLLHNEKTLDHGLLIDLGISDGDVIVVNVKSKQSNENSSVYNIPENISPEDLLKLAQSNQRLIRDMKYSDPDLAACLESNDLSKLRQFMMLRYMSKHKVVYTRQQEFTTMLNDPNNPELQKKLENTVRLFR